MKNELQPEFLSIHSINPYIYLDSASRAVMFSSHFSQKLVIEECEEQNITTGVSQEFSKYTFNVKMPCDAQIIKVIERYPRGIAEDSLNFNPETIVIFENNETKEIDYISIPYHCSHHQFFGFKYKFNSNNLSKIKPGAFVSKDTIFADSPAVGNDGSYNFGINANIAFMSLPGVSEDGMVVSEDFLKKLRFKIYETRVVEFGSNTFPLNLYGTKDKYQPFPEIGSTIRKDGLLMMLRPYDYDLSPVETSYYDLIEPDYTFDKATYSRGGEEGTVVDIKVIRNNSDDRRMPEAMTGYIEKYRKALYRFHKEIVDTELQIKNERKKKFGETKVNISPALHRLLVESLAVINHNNKSYKQNLNYLYRKSPIDEYRVEFTVEYTIEPCIGFKLTGCHGDKGVICKVEKPENMPVDSDGNRADIVTDGGSTINRMNLGRLYEHYFNSAMRDVTNQALDILGIPRKQKIILEQLEAIDVNKINQAWFHISKLVSIMSPEQYKFMMSLNDKNKYEYLTDIINEGLKMYVPIGSGPDVMDCVKTIEKEFNIVYGPVTYVGNSGQLHKTKNNIRIAPLYMMLLEKIADDWNSVSTAKLQHFGILSAMTKSEKYAHPYRCSPVRTIGETEGRIFAGYCGRNALADMYDRSNNPLTQRNMVWNILDAPKSGNIESVVDRNFIALGGAKPLQLINHIFQCSGFKYTYQPEKSENE